VTLLQHDAGHDVHGISSSACMDICHCISVVGPSSSSGSGSGSGSISACSSVLGLLRAYITRISDMASFIASITVDRPSSTHNAPWSIHFFQFC
jgi:hypothetical protein